MSAGSTQTTGSGMEHDGKRLFASHGWQFHKRISQNFFHRVGSVAHYLIRRGIERGTFVSGGPLCYDLITHIVRLGKIDRPLRRLLFVKSPACVTVVIKILQLAARYLGQSGKNQGITLIPTDRIRVDIDC